MAESSTEQSDQQRPASAGPVGASPHACWRGFGRWLFRAALSAVVPWLVATVLVSLVMAMEPEDMRAFPPHSGGDRIGGFLWGMPFFAFLLAPAAIFLGVPAKLILRLTALWCGGPTGRKRFAVLCSCAGMLVGVVTWFVYSAVHVMADHELAARCAGGDSLVIVPDPRCDIGPWDLALALIPGGAAGFAWWRVVFRRRKTRGTESGEAALADRASHSDADL